MCVNNQLGHDRTCGSNTYCCSLHQKSLELCPSLVKLVQASVKSHKILPKMPFRLVCKMFLAD